MVSGYHLCPVVTRSLCVSLSLRFPPLASRFQHHRLLFMLPLLALHTTEETADLTLCFAREIDPRFVSRELNETLGGGAE